MSGFALAEDKCYINQENTIKIIESISDHRRLNLIRKFAGEEAVEQLDAAINEVLSNGSKSLNLITDFFFLLDSPTKDTTGTYPPYAIENRKVHIIQNLKELESAVLSLKRTKLIGFDSEQKPTFKKNEPSHGVATVQLANHTDCYIVQVKKLASIALLKGLLEDETIVKVGINLTEDRRSLHAEFGIKVKATIDIDGVLAKLTSRQNIGAKKAATIFLKRNLQKSKGISTSNWEAETLSDQQIKYAAEDACVVYDITTHMLNAYPFVLKAMPIWFQSNFEDGAYTI